MASYSERFTATMNDAKKYIDLAKAAYNSGKDMDQVNELLQEARRKLKEAYNINQMVKG